MPRGAAGVFVFRANDEVLLLKVRRRNAWEYPGGKIDRGESPADAAARELREETGIDVASDALTFVTVDDRLGVDFFTFRVDLADVADVVTPKHEVTDHGWYDPLDGPEQLRPEIRDRLVQAYEERAALACEEDDM